MNPATNPYTKPNLGAPPSRHGALGAWLNSHKLTSSAYEPTRFDREKIKNWQLYFATIPSVAPGLFSLAANDTLEFEALLPFEFAWESVLVYSNQPQSVRLTLYDAKRQQAFIDPGGPELNLPNLGGDGKRRLFLKELYFFDVGSSVLANITNLSGQTQSGQIVLVGYTPGSPGMVE
ncbi:MAG: hypothetical protein WB780_20330 [Candidatus Acidiferrales bacterium]